MGGKISYIFGNSIICTDNRAAALRFTFYALQGLEPALGRPVFFSWAGNKFFLPRKINFPP